MSTVEPYPGRDEEIKAFDDTKTGVKGLVDAGITTIPRFFIEPPAGRTDQTSSPFNQSSGHQIPLIDLLGLHDSRREEIVRDVIWASGEWGFFELVNHGIPVEMMEEMLEGARRFNEQEGEEKRELYRRDTSKRVRFSSNFDLFKMKRANWRDTLFCLMAPGTPAPEELPSACRHILLEYSKQVEKLGRTLMEILSEGLGLGSSYLNDMGCTKGHALLCHYYPACPQPELTLGAGKHTDPTFFTILLQDQIGGLQFLRHGQWFSVPPRPGALIVNIGDLLQLISNDKLVSSEHRVVANHVGPRASVACFFTTDSYASPTLYGPIKELLSEDGNPPKYRDIFISEYAAHFETKGLDGRSALEPFRV